MEDTQIIELYWARSEQAIAETSAKYGSFCTSISYGILRNQQDAEECVLDTWLHTWNAIPPKNPTRFSAFLGRITRNLSLDRYRKKHAQFRGGGQVPLVLEELEQVLPAASSAEELTELQTLSDALNRFVGGLSLEKRQVFVLRYWYVRSVEEIANQLDMKKAKVNSMLYRLRRELKVQLEQEGIHL